MYIRIADHTICIKNQYPEMEAYANGYSCSCLDGESDFEISANDRDIEFERRRAQQEYPAAQHSEGYLETLAIYRKIALKMLEYDTILVHGSAIAVDGEAYLFTAKSGTGKSTHTRLWRKVFGDRVVMVNDDKPLITVSEYGVTVHGTPWDGKHRLSTNISVPLKGICILERAEDNRIEPITYREAYSMVLQQCYRPAEPIAMGRTLQLLDRLGGQVPMYRLGCNMDPQAALVAYNGMKEGNINV